MNIAPYLVPCLTLLNLKPYKSLIYRVKKWYLQESNQGHMDFQSIALPTELRYLLDGCKYSVLFNSPQNILSKFLIVYFSRNEFEL